MNIQIEHLSFRYKRPGSRSEPVLRDINLSINSGELVAIVGPSGSGKTTLLQHLTGFLQPDAGKVIVAGHDLTARGARLNDIRRRLGLVFQFPETQLFEESVFADIAFGPRNLGLSEEEVSARVHEAMHAVGLDVAQHGNRSPFHLSEGEKRRAAIAGILAMRPEALALDEPTAGLDSGGVHRLTTILQELHGRGRTIIVVSHQLDWVFSLAQRIIVLQDGAIFHDAAKATFLADPGILTSAGLQTPRLLHLVAFMHNAGLLPTKEIGTIEELRYALQADSGVGAPLDR